MNSIVRTTLAFASSLLATVTVATKSPAFFGVPEMTPVAALIFSPDGSFFAENFSG